MCLLWQVRMPLEQKAGIGLFLCLSICMIILAIVRVAGYHYRTKLDITWEFLWQQVEACIAVTMFSLTAIRSLFVAPKSRYDNRKARPWVASTGRRLHFQRKRLNVFCGKSLNEVKIPAATLSGMTRIVREQGKNAFVNQNSQSNG